MINEVFEQISETIETSEENKNSTDRFSDTIKEIFQPILEEFKDFIEENKDKKYFIGGIIKIFTILLNSRATKTTKIKKIIRLSKKIALDLWPEQKQQ